MSSPPFAPPAAWLTCPKCTAQVPCYDPAGSHYFGCFNCRTYFRADPTSPASTGHVVSGFKKELPPGPALPLGATGTLGGHHCRVVGYQVRGEKHDRLAEWREYQLRPAGPRPGPASLEFPLQLAEYQGHWLLIKQAPSFPATKGFNSFQGKEWTSQRTGNTYRLWHRYEPLIRDAQGEFDWNVLDDEQLKIQEFTCPPYLLTSEQKPNHRPTWYLAEHLEPAQVAAAFGVAVSQLPHRRGTGAAQPNPHPTAAAWRLFRLAALLLLALAGALALARPGAETNELFVVPPVAAPAQAAAAPGGETNGLFVAPAEASATPSGETPATTPAPAAGAPAPGYSHMLVSKSFELTHPAALDLTLTAPDLSNHWLEVTASLVNEQTGRGYEVTRSLEYYEGTEDGEHWTEGDRSASATLTGLPPGRYHLNLYPSPEPGIGSLDLRLRVEQHAGFASNFFLILLLMSVLPLWQWFRHSAFETGRWENSNFAPSTS